MNILLIKLDNIGDVLWATPFISALRVAHPEARLAMLVAPYSAEIAKNSPYLDEVILFDTNANVTSKLRTMRRIAKKHFDSAVVLGPVDKVNHLAFLSGARERIGYYYKNKPLVRFMNNFYLTRSLPHPADEAQRRGQRLPHEVEAMLQLLPLMGGNTAGKAEVKFHIPVEARSRADSMFGALSEGIALHVCNKSFQWGWKESDYKSLVLKLLDRFPKATILLSYGPREEKEGSSLFQILPKERLVCAAGISLSVLGALLERCRVCISWDTGIAHLASAVKIPVIDIFPGKEFDYCVQRWGIWAGEHQYLVQHTPCPDESLMNAIADAATAYAW